MGHRRVGWGLGSRGLSPRSLRILSKDSLSRTGRGALERQLFELIRQGSSGEAASLTVGVSPRCGSLWFIDAGRMNFIERPLSGRYLTQDDRIEMADGLAAGEAVKSIAYRSGKSHETVYREIAHNRTRRPLPAMVSYN